MGDRNFKSEYSEKLRDPRWQKMRLEIMQRDEFTCQVCKDKISTLHVHHKAYLKNNEPWEYPPDNLITLCEYCHEVEEFNKDNFNNRVFTLLCLGKNYDDLYKHLASMLPKRRLSKKLFDLNF